MTTAHTTDPAAFRSLVESDLAPHLTPGALVLDPDDWGRWLDPRVEDPDEIAAMLAFSRPGRFAAHPVGRAVGSSRVKGPHLLDPAPAEDLEGVVDPTTGEIIG